MHGNSFGKYVTMTTFGESHGAALGVIIDGLEPGFEISQEKLQTELDRRRPGQSQVTTPRSEKDEVVIVSGLFEGKTTGTPLTMIIQNTNQNSKDYSSLAHIHRPGHADASYHAKYGIRDYRGGGRSSGRETAARVAAGAIAKQILAAKGISVAAYTLEAAGIACKTIDLSICENNSMRAPDKIAALAMEEAVKSAAAQGNSVGGVIECICTGVPAGLGEPVFDKLDALIAHAILSLGSVKGIEFGAGFSASRMSGIEHNDQVSVHGYLSNNAGGILGGISSGQTILFRASVKPTPSVSQQQSAATDSGKIESIQIKGRHDPCICPRIVPVIEAMTAFTLLDAFYCQNGYNT